MVDCETMQARVDDYHARCDACADCHQDEAYRYRLCRAHSDEHAALQELGVLPRFYDFQRIK